MKKTELLNSDLSLAIARMGHTDELTIGDCGLPIPNTTKRIDLALCKGIPRFLDTLEVVLTELQIEKVIMAEEIKEHSAVMHDSILQLLPSNIEIEYVPHEDFKALTANSKAIVRTGETTSFANIILVSGVTF